MSITLVEKEVIMTQSSTVSPQLTQAFSDTGLSAQDFGISEEQIIKAADGSTWTDSKGNTLTKNNQNSFDIKAPEYK